MPKFGYETGGASYVAVPANALYGSVFTSPADVGTADSLTVYVRYHLTSPFSLKGAIVNHSDLTIISNGITNIVSDSDVDNSPEWKTLTFATPPTLSPDTEYVLMLISNAAFHFYYSAGDANQGHYDTSNSFTSPTDPTDASHNNNKYSIYCTYTAGGAPSGQPYISRVQHISGMQTFNPIHALKVKPRKLI